MDKNLEQCTQSRPQADPASVPKLAQGVLNVAGSPPASERAGLRFPPTRAARASRGRGVFLEDGDKLRGGGRPRWIEVPVAIVALAIAAFAVTVYINAPSMVAGGAFGPNPGPGMVAAASVAPSFVLPAKSR